MAVYYLIIVLMIIPGCSSNNNPQPEVKSNSPIQDNHIQMENYKMNRKMKFTILYDNRAKENSFREGWGFSCLVNDSILFDTGSSYDILKHNMDILGAGQNSIKKIIISHSHHDHIGGLGGLLKSPKGTIDIYLTEDSYFPADQKSEEKISVHRVRDFIDLGEGYYLSGPIQAYYKGKKLTEQFLIVRQNGKMYIVTGCAHPGIIEMCKLAAGYFPGDEIELVLGGLHLIDKDKEYVDNVIKQFDSLGVRNIAPGHCTGEAGIKRIKEASGSRYIEVYAGKVIEL